MTMTHHIDRNTLHGKSSFSGNHHNTKERCSFLLPLGDFGQQYDEPTISWQPCVAFWTMAPLDGDFATSDVLAALTVLIDGAKGDLKISS